MSRPTPNIPNLMSGIMVRTDNSQTQYKTKLHKAPTPPNDAILENEELESKWEQFERVWTACQPPEVLLSERQTFFEEVYKACWNKTELCMRPAAVQLLLITLDDTLKFVHDYGRNDPQIPLSMLDLVQHWIFKDKSSILLDPRFLQLLYESCKNLELQEEWELALVKSIIKTIYGLGNLYLVSQEFISDARKFARQTIISLVSLFNKFDSWVDTPQNDYNLAPKLHFPWDLEYSLLCSIFNLLKIDKILVEVELENSIESVILKRIFKRLESEPVQATDVNRFSVWLQLLDIHYEKSAHCFSEKLLKLKEQIRVILEKLVQLLYEPIQSGFVKLLDRVIFQRALAHNKEEEALLIITIPDLIIQVQDTFLQLINLSNQSQLASVMHYIIQTIFHPTIMETQYTITETCINKLKFAHREIAAGITNGVTQYKDRSQYLDGLSYVLMTTITDSEDALVQELASIGLFDLLFNMIREHYQNVCPLEAECLTVLKTIISNLINQEMFLQISGKGLQLSDIIFNEFLELDNAFAVDCLRKILTRRNSPNLECFEEYMQKLMATRDSSLLSNLELIFQQHEYTDSILNNSRYFNFFLHLLQDETRLDVWASTLIALKFIFSRSKHLKMGSLNKYLPILEDNLYTAYENIDPAQREIFMDTIMLCLFWIMVKSSGNRLDGDLRIRHKSVLPLALSMLHNLGTPAVLEQYLGHLDQLAKYSINNAIIMVNKDTAHWLLQFFSHDLTSASVKSLIKVSSRILTIHFRKLDLYRYLEYCRNNPVVSHIILKIIYKAGRNSWIRYGKDCWSPPRRFFLLQESSILGIRMNVKISSKGLTLYTWFNPTYLPDQFLSLEGKKSIQIGYQNDFLSVTFLDGSQQRARIETSLQPIYNTFNFLAITIKSGKTLGKKDIIQIYLANRPVRAREAGSGLVLEQFSVNSSKIGLKGRDVFEHLSLKGLQGQATSIYILKEYYTGERIHGLLNLGLNYDGNFTSDELFFKQKNHSDFVRPQVLFHLSPLAWTDQGPLPIEISQKESKDMGLVRKMFKKKRKGSAMVLSSQENVDRHSISTLLDAFQLLGGIYVLYPLLNRNTYYGSNRVVLYVFKILKELVHEKSLFLTNSISQQKLFHILSHLLLKRSDDVTNSLFAAIYELQENLQWNPKCQDYVYRHLLLNFEIWKDKVHMYKHVFQCYVGHQNKRLVSKPKLISNFILLFRIFYSQDHEYMIQNELCQENEMSMKMTPHLLLDVLDKMLVLQTSEKIDPIEISQSIEWIFYFMSIVSTKEPNDIREIMKIMKKLMKMKVYSSRRQNHWIGFYMHLLKLYSMNETYTNIIIHDLCRIVDKSLKQLLKKQSQPTSAKNWENSVSQKLDKSFVETLEFVFTRLESIRFVLNQELFAYFMLLKTVWDDYVQKIELSSENGVNTNRIYDIITQNFPLTDQSIVEHILQQFTNLQIELAGHSNFPEWIVHECKRFEHMPNETCRAVLIEFVSSNFRNWFFDPDNKYAELTKHFASIKLRQFVFEYIDVTMDEMQAYKIIVEIILKMVNGIKTEGRHFAIIRGQVLHNMHEIMYLLEDILTKTENKILLEHPEQFFSIVVKMLRIISDLDLVEIAYPHLPKQRINLRLVFPLEDERDQLKDCILLREGGMQRVVIKLLFICINYTKKQLKSDFMKLLKWFLKGGLKQPHVIFEGITKSSHKINTDILSITQLHKITPDLVLKDGDDVFEDESFKKLLVLCEMVEVLRNADDDHPAVLEFIYKLFKSQSGIIQDLDAEFEHLSETAISAMWPLMCRTPIRSVSAGDKRQSLLRQKGDETPFSEGAFEEMKACARAMIRELKQSYVRQEKTRIYDVLTGDSWYRNIQIYLLASKSSQLLNIDDIICTYPELIYLRTPALKSNSIGIAEDQYSKIIYARQSEISDMKRAEEKLYLKTKFYWKKLKRHLRFGIWKEDTFDNIWMVSNRLDKIGRKNILKIDRKANRSIYRNAINRKYMKEKRKSSNIDMSNLKLQPTVSIDDFDTAPEFDYRSHNDSVIHEAEETFTEIDSHECERICVYGSIYGKLSITNTKVEFISDGDLKPKDKYPGSAISDTRISRTSYITFRYSDVSEVYERRYLHSHSGIEFYLKSGKTYYFNFFDTKVRQQATDSLEVLFKKEKRLYVVQRNSTENIRRRNKVLKAFQNDWRHGKISNFEYLMVLNKFASRSFNDLTSYPIFPWVVQEYDAAELNYDKQQNLRPLNMAVGAIDENKLREAQGRYELWRESEQTWFHYGSHYSCSGIVLYYLLRLEPYTTQAIKLQDNHFDVADRMFSSINAAWSGCLTNTGDLKELIPELFSMPEMFNNMNSYELGTKQNGDEVCNVDLPHWSQSPIDFVHQHRKALESSLISHNLGAWIDLIFGYKQSGRRAEQSINTFFPLTYEAQFNEVMENWEDQIQRHAYIEQVAYYGQTPIQLFYTQHENRMTNAQDDNMFLRNLDQDRQLVKEVIKFNLVENPVVITMHVQRHYTLFLLEDRRLYKIRSDRSQAIIELENMNVSVSNDENLIFNPSQYAFLSEGKYLVSGMHWDNSFKLHKTANGELLRTVVHHIDQVTVISASTEYIIVGSYDTTLSVWRVPSSPHEIQEFQSKYLYDISSHIYPIVQVTQEETQGLVVSIDTQGEAILTDVLSGYGLQRIEGQKAQLAAISSHGIFALYCGTDIKIYSINGQEMWVEPGLDRQLDEDILTMSCNASGDLLITGGSNSLSVIDLFSKNRDTRVARRDNKNSEIKLRKSSIRSFALDPSQQTLLVAFYSNVVVKFSTARNWGEASK